MPTTTQPNQPVSSRKALRQRALAAGHNGLAIADDTSGDLMPTLPLERSLYLVGDKYSLQIISLLIDHETQRFVELEAAIQGISPRTLSARLKHLESHGLIVRKAYATIPPKVEYRVTPFGYALSGVIEHLGAWVCQLEEGTRVLEAQGKRPEAVVR